MSKDTWLELYEELGREPTPDEVADRVALGIDRAYEKYEERMMEKWIN